MKYKIVKLRKIKDEYKKLGLNANSLGLNISEKQEQVLTMFFNTLNQGDYLILLAEKEDLIFTDMVLPKNLYVELEEYIKNNIEKIMHKTNFEEVPFNEHEQVELIANKEKHSKYGLHKGDKGVVLSNKATKNKVLVYFGKETKDFDGFVSVSFEDIRKVNE